MNQKILFSPIGGTDPISNFRDGAMLHILRVYKPDIVYIYLSKEMCVYQDKDNRYLYCIERLEKLLNHKFQVHELKRPELINVHEYDYFYKDFNDIISDIKSKHQYSTLYLNVSSGTPAMKSALQMMASISEYRMIPIQVSTPVKGINLHYENRDNYEVEEYWELNEDNVENFENRCIELRGDNQLAAIKKGVINNHIDSYDYVAALQISKSIKDFVCDDLFILLRAASYRLQLDFSGIDKLLNSTDYDILPIKDWNRKIILEYLLCLRIKLKREEYSDFIRAITPIIAELFELVLKKQCNIGINTYSTIKRNRNNVFIRRWDRKKLANNPDLLRVLDDHFNGRILENPIASYHLSVIIDAYCNHEKTKNTVEDLSNVEQKVRNLAAHEIISVTDEWIKSNTGFTSEEIINKLKYLSKMCSFTITKDLWDSFDKMNLLIKQQL